MSKACDPSLVLDPPRQPAGLLQGRFGDCERLALDNPDTQAKGALYAAFEPEQVPEEVEFWYTPKNDSQLNIAECELSATMRRSLSGRHIRDLDELRAQIGAQSADVNTRRRTVEWQMKIYDGRSKLKSVCPRIVLRQTTTPGPRDPTEH